MGPVRHPRRARSRVTPEPARQRLLPHPLRAGPRTRRHAHAEGVARRPRVALVGCPFVASAVRARPRQPGAARVDRRGGADAAHRLRRARSRSAMPGCWPPARSRPASCSRSSGRRSGSRCPRRPWWARCSASCSACPACACAACISRCRRWRCTSWSSTLGGSTRRGAGTRTGVVIDPPRSRLHAAGRARLVLRAARRVAATRAAEPQPAAHAGPAAPGARSTAARRWPRRSASTCRSPSCSAFVVSRDADLGRRLRCSPTTAASSRPRRFRCSSPSSTSRW